MVIRCCEVQGWTNGVHHLLAMLNSDITNTARILPFEAFSRNGEDDLNDFGASDDGRDEVDRFRDRAGDSGIHVVGSGPEVEGVLDEMDEMEDWFDADGVLERIHQQVVWATHKLPQFAQLQSGERLSEDSLKKLQESCSIIV